MTRNVLPEYGESALILSLPQVSDLIQPFRERYTDDGAARVPPHITILFPFVSHDQWSEAATQTVAELAKETPPLTLELAVLAWFTGNRVLYLAPQNSDLIMGLIRRTGNAFPGRPPYGGAIPLRQIIPHVTIAVATTEAERGAIEVEVRSVLEEKLPLAVCVDTLSMWVRTDHGWQVFAEFPLQGKKARV